MGRCRETPGKGLENMAGQYDAQSCRPMFVDGALGEYLDFETSAQQAARLTSFGNLPLLILSADTSVQDKSMNTDAIARQPVWNREQEALKSLSPLSWRVIARGSGHKIYQDRPELVLSEMSGLVEYLRGGKTPPFGSTATQ